MEDFDIDWSRISWQPFEFPTSEPLTFWKEGTLSPYYSKNTSGSTDNTNIFVAIFVLLFLAIIVIICICKFHVSSDYDSYSTYVCNTVVRPPRSPLTTTTFTNRREITGVHIPRLGYARQPTQLSFTNFRTEPFPTNNVRLHNTSSNLKRNEIPSGDKPPDYASVVISDLSGETIKFPSVTSEKKDETPPPVYDEKSWPKY